MVITHCEVIGIDCFTNKQRIVIVAASDENTALTKVRGVLRDAKVRFFLSKRYENPIHTTEEKTAEGTV